MKLIIDIPENVYNRFCNCYRFPDEVEEAIIAITDGEPLPEGHGRLIDADKLHYVKMLVQNPNNGKHKHIVAVRASEINKALTIIEADKAEGSDEE